MTERVCRRPAVLDRDESPGIDRLVEGGHERVLVLAGRRGETVVREPPADDCRRADHRACARRQRRQPRPEDVAQRRRQLGAGPPVRDELLHVERQAVGAFEQHVDHGGLRPAAEDPGQLLPHLVATEGRELDPLDGSRSIQLGQERSQRVSPVQVVAAVGRDDDQPLRPHVADDEPQEIAGGSVGPVQVLDDQHERAVPGRPPERPEDSLEEPGQAAGRIHGFVAVDAARPRGDQPEDIRGRAEDRHHVRRRRAASRDRGRLRRTGHRAGRPRRGRGSHRPRPWRRPSRLGPRTPR